MAALPAPAAWRAELKCDRPANYQRACNALQNFLGTLEEDCLLIDRMGIEVLPPSYFALESVRTRLETFHCNGNHLTSLPAELGQLSALEYFSCSDNVLTTLPAELGLLSALKWFTCGDNNLTELPAELGQLSALVLFECHSNALTSLRLFDAGLSQLAALEEFACSNNALTTLPASLGRCEALKRLDVRNNSLGDFWKELAENGEPRYAAMNQIALAQAWKTRWAAMVSARRVKPARA